MILILFAAAMWMGALGALAAACGLAFGPLLRRLRHQEGASHMPLGMRCFAIAMMLSAAFGFFYAATGGSPPWVQEPNVPQPTPLSDGTGF